MICYGHLCAYSVDTVTNEELTYTGMLAEKRRLVYHNRPSTQRSSAGKLLIEILVLRSLCGPDCRPVRICGPGQTGRKSMLAAVELCP